PARFRGISAMELPHVRRLLKRLWNDDRGALIATEWVFVATLLVLGIITGLIAVRQAVLSELTEFSSTVIALNQSFSFAGQSNCLSSTAGSAAEDDNPPTDPIILSSIDAAQTATVTQAPCD